MNFGVFQVTISKTYCGVHMFKLDPRIENDSILITELSLCQVRLQNDSRYPWLVLVPMLGDVSEVHELIPEQQQRLMNESSKVASALSNLTKCKKVNVANIGNIVSQLHWHIIARFEDDETWPRPVWGVGKRIPYQDQKRAEFIDSFLKELNQT